MEIKTLTTKAKNLATNCEKLAAGSSFALMAGGPGLLREMGLLLMDMAAQIDALTPYIDEGEQ